MRLMERIALVILVLEVPEMGEVLPTIGEAWAGKLGKASVRVQRWDALEGPRGELSHWFVHHGAWMVATRRTHLRAISSFVRRIEEQIIAAIIVVLLLLCLLLWWIAAEH